jgi:hypothetical protein
MNLSPELVRAFTPIFLGLMGTVIGLTALVTAGKGQDARLTAGLGLAGTAIAGAAGLAQPHKSDPGVSIERDGQKFKIESPPSSEEPTRS